MSTLSKAEARSIAFDLIPWWLFPAILLWIIAFYGWVGLTVYLLTRR